MASFANNNDVLLRRMMGLSPFQQAKLSIKEWNAAENMRDNKTH